MSQPQPPPTANEHPATWDLVHGRVLDKMIAVRETGRDVTDYTQLYYRMRDRDDLGYRRYGVRLQPHNGRDSLADARDEALDLCVYLENAHTEKPSLRLRMLADKAVAFALELERFMMDERQPT